LWNYFKSFAPDFNPKWTIRDYKETDIRHSVIEEGVSAPTASELVERLPYMVAIKNREYSISYHKIDHRYSCSLICESEQEGYCENICQQERGDSCRYNVFEDKLADALAKMWLYLKKNKLLAGDPNE